MTHKSYTNLLCCDCDICNYVTETQTSLVNHLTNKHPPLAPASTSLNTACLTEDEVMW